MNLDISSAIKKIRSEELRGNNPIPDILSFLHIKVLYKNLSIRLQKLLKEYSKSDRNVKPLLKIDVPKANYTIRPMARPETTDWIIYEAITDILAKKLLSDDKICKRSYSILNYKSKKANKTEAWLKFDDHCRELYEKGFKYAVVTDLTGYFENINLKQLRQRIRNYLGTDNKYDMEINILFNLLRKWSIERVQGYGLPQGPPASRFLADIYLDYIDRKMEKYKGYCRYMDDIRIFCERKIEAKVALKELIIVLRELKLNVNAQKTAILNGREIEDRLFDKNKPLLNIIESVMKARNRALIKKIIPTLEKLCSDAFSNDPFEKTHLTFALYRLGILYDSGFKINVEKIIEIIQSNFTSKPHLAGIFCNFLSLFPNNETIVAFLISFLQSEDNIYEWQEMKVLQTLLQFNVKFESKDIDFFIESARNPKKHFAVRAFYFLLTGKFGDNRDRDSITDYYSDLTEPYIKLALIMAVQELECSSRNSFYAKIKQMENNDEVIQFIDYIKSLKRPLYYLTTERPKYELLPY